jgi:hypothetical protein
VRRVNARAPAAATALAAALAGLAAGGAAALETDQFAAWRRPLRDSGTAVNARIDLEIRLALDEVNARGGGCTCEDVALAVDRRLEFEIFQPLELWAIQSPLVDQSPARGDDEARFLHESIYRRSHPWDIAMWMPLSPTIEVNGIRFGTDKLAHFASSGWKYYKAYEHRIRRGETPPQAEAGAIRWGILEERSINGSLSSGIFSRSDLEADWAGMRFYLGLCSGPDPVVELADGKWRVRRPYDIRPEVTPEWDESYLLPIYRKGRWKEVRPEIEASCASIDDPEVRSRLDDYRRRDAETPSERVVDELAREGHLPDPAQFSLAAVCPQAAALPRPEAPPERAAPPGPPFPPGMPDEILAAERDRSRRTYNLWRGAISVPLSAAATFGVVSTTLPRTSDCRSLCEMRGLTAHLSAGLTGGEVAFGWARLFAESTHGQRSLRPPPLAYGVRGAVIRTWGDSALTPQAQTLVGAELALTITRVSFTAGVFVPVDAGHHHQSRVFTGSIGFGF